MTRSARRRLRFLPVVIGCAAIAAVWLGLPRNGLLDHAILLVPSSQWVGPERHNGDIGNYAWLTDSEVLLFRRNPDMTLTLLRKKVLPPGQDDVATPLATPPLVQPEWVTLSPDRTMLHVVYFHPGAPRKSKRRVTSEFVSLSNGRSFGIFPGRATGTLCDGSRILCDCIYDKKLVATLRHYDGRNDEEIVINGLAGAPLMRSYVWSLFIEASGRVVALGDSYYDGIVTPADRMKLGSKLSPVRILVEFNLKDPNRKGRMWTVPVPKDAAHFICQVSPSHDRLLWIVESNRMPFLPAITQSLPRPWKQPPRYLCRWMVSDLEGRNMHTIAEFEISDLYFLRPDLLTPEWTPDGKHLSFEYRSALYRMPVD